MSDATSHRAAKGDSFLVYDRRQIGCDCPDPMAHQIGCPDAPPLEHRVRCWNVAQTEIALRRIALRSCPKCRQKVAV